MRWKIDDLEFSDIGRSARFAPGWWIALGFGLLVCDVGAVFAQTPAQQPAQSPREQALSHKLVRELNENLQLSSDLISAQQEVKRLQDELAKHNKSDAKRNPTAEKP